MTASARTGAGEVAGLARDESLAGAATVARRRRLRFTNRTLVAGLAILAVLVGLIFIYPLLSPYDPRNPDFSQPTFAGPSWSHPLGTDNFGRDTLTRLTAGGGRDLLIAFLATWVTVAVGTALGLLTGYTGGWLDTLIMRLVDFSLSIPYLILVIAIVAIFNHPGTMNIVYAIWAVGWVAYVRIVRGETLVARRLEYVEAARVVGMSGTRIVLRHILPNVISAAVVFAMADMVLNILVSTSLSYLGLGVQSPTPEWGLMVAEARDFFLKDWQLMTYPGIAIMLIGAAFGLIGDGLAQALRPKG